MISRTFIFAILSMISVSSFSQSAYDKFYEDVMAGRYSSAEHLLDSLENRNVDDPELIPARFNLYLNKSKEQVLVLTGDTISTQEALILKNDDGETAGLITNETYWDEHLFDKAILTIENGIQKYPQRLDFRFGEAKALEIRERFEDLVVVLSGVIEKSSQASNTWLWSEDEPLDDNSIVADAIFDYCRVLYNAEAYDELKKLCAKYNETLNPDIKILNISAAVYYFEGNYEKALEEFKKANQIDPDDGIILCNIGQLYVQTGDIEKAKTIYREIISNEKIDEDSKDVAKEMLQTLQ